MEAPTWVEVAPINRLIAWTEYKERKGRLAAAAAAAASPVLCHAALP